ncbi:hypothetical protein BDZ89DRAFT_1048186 [Hymenopellis radicata]|nr:hypothetical protein BDZ89DRAFT_1048186 [Hymenopellis radicata]
MGTSWSMRELLVTDGFDEREPRVAADWHVVCRLPQKRVEIRGMRVAAGLGISHISSTTAVTCSQAESPSPRLPQPPPAAIPVTSEMYRCLAGFVSGREVLLFGKVTTSTTSAARFPFSVAESGATAAWERDERHCGMLMVVLVNPKVGFKARGCHLASTSKTHTHGASYRPAFPTLESSSSGSKNESIIPTKYTAFFCILRG